MSKTALNHKIPFDAPHQQAVIGAGFGELKKKIAMPGYVIVQPHPDVAQTGMNDGAGIFFLKTGKKEKAG